MKQSLKFAVIGGGSSYTPELIEGILRRKDSLPVSEIWLVDIEDGKEKQKIIAGLARRMAAARGVDIKIVDTLDRREALRGADFVISQFRVGGLEARSKDESIPLKYNTIGQETTGAGGYANAIRTIPVLLAICRDIEELAPNAWLINFTNPSGINTEAVLNHTKVKAIGLCNVPIGIKRDIAKLLEVEPDRIEADFIGLNHMSYVPAVYLDGEDILPMLLEKYAQAEPGSELYEKLEAVSDIVWDGTFIKSLGMITSPYHRYFYAYNKMLEEEKRDMSEKGSRAMQVMEIEKKLFEIYAREELCEKPKELEKRGGAYYSEAAISLVDSIYNNRMDIHTVNVKNNGAILDLPADAVVEVNALIGCRGATPLTTGVLPDTVAGLVRDVKGYEQLTVKAGVTRSYRDALLALINNPFITDAVTAEKMLDEMIVAHSEFMGDLS